MSDTFGDPDKPQTPRALICPNGDHARRTRAFRLIEINLCRD
jgi:hypothetical protein